MALTQINPTEEKQKKSALEKFATGLGIATSLGQIGVMGSKILGPKTPGADSGDPLSVWYKKNKDTDLMGR
jgi:hypothetical protein